MTEVIAQKRVTYAGRVRLPGVAFHAHEAHARLMIAMGFASVRVHHTAPAASGIDELRAAYTAKAGKAPDSRWREKRLQKEIAAL
jgi:uncharacterized protein YfaT (DUF1175 family)